MSAPYLLISDTHYHSWSEFSKTVNGVNSRLAQIIGSTYIAAASLKAHGGKVIIHAGDCFHVRGRLEPSVLNPVVDLYKGLIEDGFQIYMLPGNHDLQGNDSERVSNAVTALEAVGVVIAHAPMFIPDVNAYLFPWYSSVDALTAAMGSARVDLINDDPDFQDCDAIIHAPIDGVLPHLPPHGATAKDLAHIGYRRVFAGHYHHHRDMGDGVYSIGALTHQTWGDVGSQAGFVIVDGDEVMQYESGAPKFIDFDPDMDPDTITGNYVRARLEFEDLGEVDELRESLIKMGAAGVRVNAVRKPQAATRVGSTAATASGSVSIESSIEGWVGKRALPERVHRDAVAILNEAREVAES